MQRQPFPKPGARLVDAPHVREEGHGAGVQSRRISVFGGVGYAPGHPSRWAGIASGGTSRLTVENESVVIRPYRFWRQVFRLPVVEIPLASIGGLNRIMFGVRFEVPDDPVLDGTRFGAWAMDVVSLEPLIELLQRRGVVVETLPRPERSKRALHGR